MYACGCAGGKKEHSLCTRKATVKSMDSYTLLTRLAAGRGTENLETEVWAHNEWLLHPETDISDQWDIAQIASEQTTPETLAILSQQRAAPVRAGIVQNPNLSEEDLAVLLDGETRITVLKAAQKRSTYGPVAMRAIWECGPRDFTIVLRFISNLEQAGDIKEEILTAALEDGGWRHIEIVLERYFLQPSSSYDQDTVRRILRRGAEAESEYSFARMLRLCREKIGDETFEYEHKWQQQLHNLSTTSRAVYHENVIEFYDTVLELWETNDETAKSVIENWCETYNDDYLERLELYTLTLEEQTQLKTAFDTFVQRSSGATNETFAAFFVKVVVHPELNLENEKVDNVEGVFHEQAVSFKDCEDVYAVCTRMEQTFRHLTSRQLRRTSFQNALNRCEELGSTNIGLMWTAALKCDVAEQMPVKYSKDMTRRQFHELYSTVITDKNSAACMIDLIESFEGTFEELAAICKEI